jgi:hypothetical protein
MANQEAQKQIINEVADRLAELQQVVIKVAESRPDLETYCRQAAENASELDWLLDVLVQEL